MILKSGPNIILYTLKITTKNQDVLCANLRYCFIMWIECYATFQRRWWVIICDGE